MISFIRDSFSSLMWKLLNLGIGIAIASLISRGLGPDGRGGYDLALIFVMFYVILVNLGTENALIYFIGKKKHPIASMISTLMVYATTVYLVLTASLFFLYQTDSLAFLRSFSPRSFYLCLAVVYPQILATLIRHVFLALKKVKQYNVCITIEFIAYVIMLSALSFYSMSLEKLLSVYLIANLISFSYNIFLFRKLKLGAGPSLFKVSILKELLGYGVKFFSAGFAGFWQSRIGLLYLTSYHGNASVGYFTTANKLPQLLIKIPNEVSLILYPYAAGMTEESESAKLIAFVLKWLVLYPAVIFTLVVSAILPELMDLLFGEAYAETVPTAFLLIFAAVLTGCTSVMANYLSANGLVKFSAYAGFINFAVVVIGGFLVIRAYDYYGLALLVLTGAFVGFAFIILRVKMQTKLPWSVLLILNKREFGQMKDIVRAFLNKKK